MHEIARITQPREDFLYQHCASSQIPVTKMMGYQSSRYFCRSHGGVDDDETAPSAPQIEVSPAPVLFTDDLQVLTVDRAAKKGTPIGQIRIANPGRRRLTWTMRHRYRYGG